MTIGWFGRAYNFKHKSLSTQTHVIHNNKVICGYRPHKTMKFQYCAKDNIDYIECKICLKKYLKLTKRGDY